MNFYVCTIISTFFLKYQLLKDSICTFFMQKNFILQIQKSFVERAQEIADDVAKTDAEIKIQNQLLAGEKR